MRDFQTQTKEIRKVASNSFFHIFSVIYQCITVYQVLVFTQDLPWISFSTATAVKTTCIGNLICLEPNHRSLFCLNASKELFNIVETKNVVTINIAHRSPKQIFHNAINKFSVNCITKNLSISCKDVFK